MSAIGSVMLMCHLTCLELALSFMDRTCRLPARLDHAGNFPAHRDVAQLVAAEAELAENTAWTTRELAAVAQPRRARIARELLQPAPCRQPFLIGNLDVAHD